MSDFNTSKIDGNTVGSGEWNQLADVDNLVINSGQTPSSSNLDQLAIASSRYSSGGQFFTDSGTANAYILTPVSPFKSPVSSGAGEGYFTGMIIRFRAGNANSGASTINVNSAGVKNLKKADGTDVATGDILTTRDVSFRYDGTNFIKVENVNPATTTIAGIVLAPIQTITKYTSGSGTYTLPTNCRYIRVKMVGGGGGGGGSGTAGGQGGTGGSTTFGASFLTCNGGVGGFFNGGTGSVGGGSTINAGANGTGLTGGYGGSGVTTNVSGSSPAGGNGGNSPFGGGGSGAGGSAGTTGSAGIANTGGGGGGSGGSATTTFGGAGGGAGGYIDAIVASPSATYSYSIGAGGSGGTAGTSGYVGGAGGSGYIEITEYYY